VNSPLVSGSLLGVVAVAAAVGAVACWTDAVALRDHGIRAEALVLQVHGGKNSYVVLEFATRDGRDVTAEVGNYSWRPTPRSGDTATILYDPADPTGNVADVRTGPDFLAAWLLGAGAVIAAVVSVLTFQGRIDWDRFSR
jgi:hypothetical protein